MDAHEKDPPSVARVFLHFGHGDRCQVRRANHFVLFQVTRPEAMYSPSMRRPPFLAAVFVPPLFMAACAPRTVPTGLGDRTVPWSGMATGPNESGVALIGSRVFMRARGA